MKISRKPTPPRPPAPSRPSRLVTADTALARAKISGMGLGGPNWLPELPEGGSSADDHLQAVLTAKTPGDLVPVLASLRDGEIVDVENISKYVTPEFAYVVRVERAKSQG
jgi:hypothetical protein